MEHIMAATKQVPFTVHVRVVPKKNGKRWEEIRDLQKISVLVYDGLVNMSSVYQFATPGGGQSAGFSDINKRSAFGSFAPGVAIKPQIGQSPAQLMITGFFESSAANTQSYTNFQRISGGTTYSGPGSHSNDAVPVSAVNDDVKTIKTALTNAITTALPASVEFSIFRLEYAGVVYGDKGFHFPQ
jgi:hypothetical protein